MNLAFWALVTGVYSQVGPKWAPRMNQVCCQQFDGERGYLYGVGGVFEGMGGTTKSMEYNISRSMVIDAVVVVLVVIGVGVCIRICVICTCKCMCTCTRTCSCTCT